MEKIGKIIKITSAALVLLICVMFILRCCMAGDKSVFADICATEALRSAYVDGESNTFTVEISAEIADDGYFSAYAFYYNDESGEAQLAVRWNDSVYGYTDIPEGYEFTVKLRNETTGEEYLGTTVDAEERLMYNYRKIIVSGCKFGEGDQISAVMPLRDEFESVQVLKYAEQPFEEYKIKGKLLRELTE